MASSRTRVTTGKYNGDDQQSWAFFINDVPQMDLTGLNRSQARYYKQLVLEQLAANEAKRRSSG